MNQYIPYIPATGIRVCNIDVQKLRQSFQQEKRVSLHLSSEEFEEKETIVQVIGIDVKRHRYKVHIFRSDTETKPIAERILSVQPLSKKGKIEHVQYW